MPKEASIDPVAPLPAQSAWRRFAALAGLLLLMAVGYILGLHNYLTLEAIAQHRASIESFTQQYWLPALLAFMAIYVAAVALSFPGAIVLTVLGGLLFGWLVAGFVVVFCATLGGAIIFSVVKTALGEGLVRKAGPFLCKISDGFSKDAFNYLLFLRLVPLFPFWLVNIAAGVANVKLRTFILATFFGIIPASFTFAYVGEGLDSVLDAQNAAHGACVAEKGESSCPFDLSLSSLVTTELLIAFAALGMLALVPVALRRWRPPA
jgi:uncharacterized membrane protein YdjX (TVP38/TMEM64 family)